MKKGFNLWILWFVLIMVVALSPIVAPYNNLDLIYGIPFTLFWWIAISLVIIFSIILFVNHQIGDLK